jgi:hypothetical protein
VPCAHLLARKRIAHAGKVLGREEASVDLATQIPDELDRRSVLPPDAPVTIDDKGGKLHGVQRLEDVGAQGVDELCV